jgi:rubrerythrin
MSGFEEAVFIAISKNTSEYHCEFVEADSIQYAYLMARVEHVMSGQAAKVSDKPDDWRCNFCFKKGVCWEGLEVEVRCSTCSFAFPREDGGWQCDKHDRQCHQPCDDYELYRPKEKGM